MKSKSTIIIILTLVVLLSGCTKKFRLERGSEYPRAILPNSGGFDGESLGKTTSGFSGKLNLKWQRKLHGQPIGPLSIGAGKLIACTTTGRIGFVDPKNGRYLGKYNARANVQTGLTVIDSLAYFAAGPIKNRLVCFNLHNRKTLWRAGIKDITGTPIIINNRIYLAADFGWVECRDRITGDIIWRDSVGAKSLAGPSFDGGVVYFPLDDGRLLGFEELTGKMIINVDLKQPLVSKVAIDGMVFISGMAGTFSALDKKTGEIIWERSFEWPIWTSPAIDENMVYVGDNGGLLRALDKKDGRTLWNFQADGVILSAPITVGNYLIFASLDKYLYCIDKKSGLLNAKWKNDREIRFPAISDGESVYVISQDGLISCLGD